MNRIINIPTAICALLILIGTNYLFHFNREKKDIAIPILLSIGNTCGVLCVILGSSKKK